MKIPGAALRVRRPRSLAEAADVLAQVAGAGRVVAGATALQLEWRRGQPLSAYLIDVTGLADLAGISAGAGRIRIGAATRLAELEESRLVAEQLPLLAETLGRVAAPGIRRLATLGGNIAGRTGCLIPTLLVLGASVEVAIAGAVSALPLRDWLRMPARHDDIIVAVLVPPIAAAHRATNVGRAGVAGRRRRRDRERYQGAERIRHRHSRPAGALRRQGALCRRRGGGGRSCR
jgi:CO/xanthine dehydrogenase FAD-binding subunit